MYNHSDLQRSCAAIPFGNGRHQYASKAASQAMKGFQPVAGSKADIWGAKYIRPSMVSSNVIAEPYKGPPAPLPLTALVTPSGWRLRWSRWKDSFKSMYSLSRLKKHVKGWHLKSFKMESLDVYKKTCQALAAGDISTLRHLTTPPIFSDMKKQIKQRRDGGWTRIEWKMVEDPALYDLEMLHARLVSADPKDDSNGFVQLTVKLPTKQVFAAYDKSGRKVAGDETKEVQVVDHWVFEIPLSSKSQQRWRVAGRLSIYQ